MVCIGMNERTYFGLSAYYALSADRPILRNAPRVIVLNNTADNHGIVLPSLTTYDISDLGVGFLFVNVSPTFNALVKNSGGTTLRTITSQQSVWVRLGTDVAGDLTFFPSQFLDLST